MSLERMVMCVKEEAESSGRMVLGEGDLEGEVARSLSCAHTGHRERGWGGERESYTSSTKHVYNHVLRSSCSFDVRNTGGISKHAAKASEALRLVPSVNVRYSPELVDNTVAIGLVQTT